MPERVDPVAMGKFHKHLDVCKQCEEHPFDLCSVGLPLLLACAPSVVAEHCTCDNEQGCTIHDRRA
jgi:hypothetical protein